MPTLRAELEEIIQQKHLLSHSFYQRWQMGELTLEELQGYAKEYYPFENEFSRLVSSVHSRCESLPMRQMLLQNLTHEEEGPDNHAELWLRFAEGLGVTREEVENHFHSDQTENLLRTFRKHTQSENVTDGFAALYSYERQQPDVARQKIEGLKRWYQISDDRTLSFFKAHQVSDIYHSETEAACLEKLCETVETKAQAKAVINETLDALYDFLTGVENRYRVK